VKIAVKGGGPNLCSYFGGSTCGVSSDSLLIAVTIDYHGGGGCFDLAWTYTQTCNFGLLPAGNYVTVIAETRDPRDPQHSSLQSISFQVTDPTPASSRTWAMLKSIYR